MPRAALHHETAHAPLATTTADGPCTMPIGHSSPVAPPAHRQSGGLRRPVPVDPSQEPPPAQELHAECLCSSVLSGKGDRAPRHPLGATLSGRALAGGICRAAPRALLRSVGSSCSRLFSASMRACSSFFFRAVSSLSASLSSSTFRAPAASGALPRNAPGPHVEPQGDAEKSDTISKAATTHPTKNHSGYVTHHRLGREPPRGPHNSETPEHP